MADVLLCIEASTYRGSVALVSDVGVVAERNVAMKGELEERLMPAVAELVDAASLDGARLSGVICGAGPGSFTSLRIAAAIAKGIACGRNVPMFAASSLELIVAANVHVLNAGRYVAMLDAMRGDYYCQLCELGEKGAVNPLGSMRLLSADQARDFVTVSDAIAVGPGQQLDLLPSGRGCAALLSRVTTHGRVDIADWEPTYGRLAEAEVKRQASQPQEAAQR